MQNRVRGSLVVLALAASACADGGLVAPNEVAKRDVLAPAADHVAGELYSSGPSVGVTISGNNVRIRWHRPTGSAYDGILWDVKVCPQPSGTCVYDAAVVGTLDASYSNPHLYFDVTIAAGGSYKASVKPASPQSVPAANEGVNWRNSKHSSVFQVQVSTNRPPTVGFTWTPQSPNEGEAVAFDATASDPDGDALSYAWDFGDGTTSTQVDPSHTYDDNGTYQVKLAVSDGKGGSAEVEIGVVVANVAPTATFSNSGPVDEGSSFTLQLSDVADPSGADVAAGFTYAFDCGDGAGYGAYASTASASCATTDNGTRSVKGKVMDKDGGASEYTASVVVNNVAPTILTLAASSYGPMPVTGVVTVSGTFSDPGTADTHTLTLNCDGGIASGTSAAQPSYSGTCTFSNAGVYLVSATITDDDGGSDSRTDTQYIVVYDPSAGFVTGGGWINSPAGAYAADPSLSGKATFGFVSKYQKGATVPTGNTEFQFHAAGMNFKSTAYQWLVISGPQAQYKGEGAINGVAGYGFILTARDGQQSGGGSVDMLRLKITDAGGSVVYDNQMGAALDAAPSTALGGGSIVIQTGGKNK